ncbi:hypothetical protein VIGAN_UM029200, partial [Vigna angularis var. angularis]
NHVTNCALLPATILVRSLLPAPSPRTISLLLHTSRDTSCLLECFQTEKIKCASFPAKACAKQSKTAEPSFNQRCTKPNKKATRNQQKESTFPSFFI